MKRGLYLFLSVLRVHESIWGREEERKKEERGEGEGIGREKRRHLMRTILLQSASQPNHSSVNRMAHILGYKRSLKVIRRIFLISLE